MPQIRFYVKDHVWEKAVLRAGGSPKRALQQIKTMVEMSYGEKAPTTSRTPASHRVR